MRVLRGGLVAALGLLALGLAHADGCTKLRGQTQCQRWFEGKTPMNGYTVHYRRNGEYVVDGVRQAPGSWACNGENLLEVQYVDDAGNAVRWYGEAAKDGQGTRGNGESQPLDLKFYVETSAGACGVAR